jgi:hypothetical protein
MSTPPGYGSAWFPVPAGPPGLYGYGGVSYGYGSGVFPRAPVPVTGGYGGAAYGLSSYGSVDIEPPHLVGARSINGTTVELSFSEAMSPNAALTDPASYTVVPTLGAPVTVLAAAAGTASTVLITHTGTTLGGTYTVTVVGALVDAVGNPVIPGGTAATFRARGTAPTATVTATDGTHVLIDVSEDLVPESVWSPGASSTSSYEVSTAYPVVPTLDAATNPVGGDASRVSVEVTGMTSTTYDLTVGPAISVDYAGGELPSAATGFQGVEVGTGTSTLVGGTLILTKAVGVSYGWAFEDTSGRVAPGCTFRADVEFDASAATVTPSLVNGTLATVVFSDGIVQVAVAVARVAGIDVLDVTSGAYTAQVPVDWSSGAVHVALVRNALAGLFAVLVDGEPLVSASETLLTGLPTVAPGVEVTLGPACAVSGFPLETVALTASSTVFTTSWNFIHGLVSPFVGSAATARAKLLTQRGPLVRDWGDWTPATVADVEVRVNGVPVTVADVNPYMGEVTPAVPIPLTPPGTTTVAVDYAWFQTPAFPLVGLNTGGLVLNKWDLPVGQQSGVGSPAPLPPGHLGAMGSMRFPYGVALGPLNPPRPLHVGHRYIGFEREYSALTNSPTTLLLNQNPNAVVRGDLAITPDPVFLSYEGTVPPVDDGWALVGVDSGGPGTGPLYERYVLVDAGTDTGALYTRDVDVRFPSAVIVAAQVQVSAPYTPSGAMVGPVVGFHDDDRLYLAGPVIVDDMRHVGILVDAARPDLAESWEVGPAFAIEIVTSTTFSTSSSLFAAAQARGDVTRFRIPSGPQAGVYEVSGCGVSDHGDGTYTVAVTPAFPADPTVFGGSAAVAVVEVPWDEQPVSLRLVSDTATRDTVLYVGGAVPSSTVSVAGLPTTAEPADTYLTIPTQGGAVFWGSAARAGTSTSVWAYVRASVQPDATTYHYRGSTVTAPTATTPDVPLDGWSVEEAFGHGSVSAGRQVIERTAADPDVPEVVFGYSRTEPFLTERVVTDVDFTLVVDSASATGGGEVVVSNGVRRVVMATLAYVEGGAPLRRLAEVPTVSALCTRDPVADGWDVDADAAAVSYLDFRGVVVTAGAGQPTRWSRELPVGVDGTTDTVADAEFSTDAPGPEFRVPAGGRTVGLGVATGPDRVVLLAGSVEVVGFPFAWNDGRPHRYRLLTNLLADAVSVLADGVLLGTAALSAFPAGDRRVSFGVGASTAGCVATWFAAAAHPLFAPFVRRTLGIASPGPGIGLDNIDGWTIPRSDGTGVPNSSLLATVIPMDWSSEVRIRVRLDPQWGATLYRPDLPLPTGGAWATDTTRPSDGWVNVEYPRLPRAPSVFGGVSFGSLAAGVLSTSRWGDLRYQVRTVNSGNFIAPQGMVLNRYNVITSGELLRDTQPEVVTVPVVGRTVSLAPGNVTAARVYSVAVGSAVLSASAWTFDPDAQVVTLVADPPPGTAVVTVTFVPGPPVTQTYLCSQPLHQSTTLLNEGTPPVPASQGDPAVRVVEAGSAINDPGDVLVDPGFTLNDPTRYVTFTDPAEERYDSLEFCEVDDGGQRNLISTLCDGPAIGHGLAAIAMSGTMFSEQQSADGGPARWGGPVPMRDTVLNYRQEPVLLAHGGVALAGGAAVLNQNVVLPNYPSVSGPDRGAVIRATTMRMRVSAVLTDATVPVEAPLSDVYGGAADNVPPSAVAGAVVPDGAPAPSGNGACVAEVVDYSTTTYSRLGPWGGLTSLTPRSLLGGGGLPPSGVGLTLVGGASLTGSPTVTVVNVQSP